LPDLASALTETGRRVGRQILVAAAATAAGFLAFVPTSFRGVAELGLIAGVGMIIAFFCTLIFLPAFIALFRPKARRVRSVSAGASRPTGWCTLAWQVVAVFGAVAVLAVICCAPHLRFRSAAHQECVDRGGAHAL